MVQKLTGEGAIVEKSMPEVDLMNQYSVTFSEETTLFAEQANGAESSLESYLMAMEGRDEVMRAWEAFFADWDVRPNGTARNSTSYHKSVPIPSRLSRAASYRPESTARDYLSGRRSWPAAGMTSGFRRSRSSCRN